jgi:2-keto-4-pentenoate hydratase
VNKNILSGETKVLADRIYAAFKEGNRIPHVSRLKPGITASEAYEVQKEYVRLRLEDDSICGFKAGLCTRGAQAKLDYSEPLSGILYSSGNFRDADIPLFPSGRMIIETEIGMVISKDITSPVKDREEMKSLVDEVMPAIEFPNKNFMDPADFGAVDLIACDVIAAGSFEGKRMFLGDLDLNSVEVSLYRDGEKIDGGTGNNTWKNDQWESALWLVNSIISSGYTIKKGQFLLTGALGTMVAASEGAYRADYGELGVIEFTLASR